MSGEPTPAHIAEAERVSKALRGVTGADLVAALHALYHRVNVDQLVYELRMARCDRLTTEVLAEMKALAARPVDEDSSVFRARMDAFTKTQVAYDKLDRERRALMKARFPEK